MGLIKCMEYFPSACAVKIMEASSKKLKESKEYYSYAQMLVTLANSWCGIAADSLNIAQVETRSYATQYTRLSGKIEETHYKFIEVFFTETSDILALLYDGSTGLSDETIQESLSKIESCLEQIETICKDVLRDPNNSPFKKMDQF